MNQGEGALRFLRSEKNQVEGGVGVNVQCSTVQCSAVHVAVLLPLYIYNVLTS